MKKEYIPYYISRAILSVVFAVLVFRLTWQAALFACVLFGLFLLYLHSGWFRIDMSQPLIPLRRDDRSAGIQRKALIAAAVIGLLAYLVLTLAANALGLPPADGAVALSLGVLAYFISQFVLYQKT